jgi:hypothetical protein
VDFSDEPESIDGFCPTCNRMARLVVRAKAHGTAPPQLFDQLSPGEEGLRGASYRTAFCPQCETVFLRASAESEPSDIRHEAMLYPPSERRSIPGVPDVARRAYASAISCFETGNFEPSVIMCRKCVEAVCENLGARDGRLVDRLRKLRDEGRIEERLYRWADELRLVGNDAAHDLDIRIGKEDARDSLDFVEAILLYVFALDQKFNDFTARRKRSKVAGS